jgi:hypothetical protein
MCSGNKDKYWLIKVLDFDLCAKKYYVSEISSVDDFTYNHYNDGCQMHK